MSDRPGYVYVMGTADGWCKIGKTRSPRSRIHELRVASPLELYVIALFQEEDVEGEEAWYHDFFADQRGRGEWFSLSEDETNWLRGTEWMRQWDRVGPTMDAVPMAWRGPFADVPLMSSIAMHRRWVDFVEAGGGTVVPCWQCSEHGHQFVPEEWVKKGAPDVGAVPDW